jgi:hypothetical protein
VAHSGCMASLWLHCRISPTNTLPRYPICTHFVRSAVVPPPSQLQLDVCRSSVLFRPGVVLFVLGCDGLPVVGSFLLRKRTVWCCPGAVLLMQAVLCVDNLGDNVSSALVFVYAGV